MRCTNCNQEIKPVVAIDIDGTMGMYHEHFLQFASNYLFTQPNYQYHGAEPFKDWFTKAYEVDAHVWHDIKLAYRQGGMKRTMPMYLGARDLCRDVRDAGAELWITTTRPYIRHDNVDPDTRWWLKVHGIEYDYLLYDGHKYEKLNELVGAERICAVLDDLPDEIDEANRLFGNGIPIWRMNEFNSAHYYASILSVITLSSAGNIITERIQEWKDHYGHIS